MSFFISTSIISFHESWGTAEKKALRTSRLYQTDGLFKTLTMCEQMRYNFMLYITQSHNSFYRHQGWCDRCDTWKLLYVKCNAESEDIHLIRICLRLLLTIIVLKAAIYWLYCTVLGLSYCGAYINARI